MGTVKGLFVLAIAPMLLSHRQQSWNKLRQKWNDMFKIRCCDVEEKNMKCELKTRDQLNVWDFFDWSVWFHADHAKIRALNAYDACWIWRVCGSWKFRTSFFFGRRVVRSKHLRWSVYDYNPPFIWLQCYVGARREKEKSIQNRLLGSIWCEDRGCGIMAPYVI